MKKDPHLNNQYNPTEELLKGLQNARKQVHTMKVVGCAIASILILLIGPFFLVLKDAKETPHYYKIERLNVDGKVQQTYISKGRFPWTGEHSVTFTEYPCGHFIRINSNYTIEDLGTKLDAL